jgi:PadR family transcriptional regulator
MGESRSDVLQGTLDLMVMKTLDTMGALHSYAIAKRLEQVSEEALQLNQGTLYPALVRLEQQGVIAGEWRVTENGRRAKYYDLTRAGRKELAAKLAGWERTVSLMSRILRAQS